MKGAHTMGKEPHATPSCFPPCCPELKKDDGCDALDFHYRLVHTATVVVNDQRQTVPVEVLLHARLERCPGPLALGDLVYSQTLFPGEKVRLFTTDRRSRFTFDSATKLSYRNEQAHEEQFYLSSMSESLSDLEVRDSASASSRSSGSASSHADASGVFETLFSGPSVGVSGSYNAESTSDFLRELSQHARASHHASEQGTRAASSVSIGEVQTRSHSEGESQDHFESSSREFTNPNHCHAVTFFFYRLNKTQTVRFKLVAIERRVIDPAADTRVTKNPAVADGRITTIPAGVLATAKDRLEVERVGRESVAAQLASGAPAGGGTFSSLRLAVASRTIVEPLPAAVRQQALQEVDGRLVAAGLLTAVGGQVAPKVVLEFSFEVQSSLPTPGLLVKGCLDECDICEPELKRMMELELQGKELENLRLQRQIDLMEKDQEHRCCPAPSEPAP
jgi:hypothetical protein